MAMQLRSVVPFGRSLDEYQNLFNLLPDDLKRQILGVGDGPASFNAEVTQAGGQVISIDPLYQFSGADIWQQFQAVVDDIIDQVRATPEDWVWTYHASPDELRQHRETVIQRFLADYPLGRSQGRYRVGALPTLPFTDRHFELALCSHFLFLYSDYFDQAFHYESIVEMLRVSQEVRIFPLLTLMLQPSPHLNPVIDRLQGDGYQVAIVPVAYELQKGGNHMLVVRHLPAGAASRFKPEPPAIPLPQP